ncbi:cytochrome P450 family protein [Saccharothrix syringae]|uniref:Cytochrome P450 n=1 Tax=Saccharothrix syringae TaxID=103733 RepID=A0A5Q0H2Z9_SACSY|nr:cytochrome P450 [Saccharothrix syringae]QFZ20092.1 cytochrome P450 [Saccharothrix syringae]
MQLTAEFAPDRQALVGGSLRGWQHHAHEDALARTGPVHPAELPNGLEVLVTTLGLEATRTLLGDNRLSKDAAGLRAAMQQQLADKGRPTDLSRIIGPSMLNTDPPHHRKLRALVSQAFTPRRIEALRPAVERTAAELVAGMSGEVDLISRLAFPLPLAVICDLLGVPAEDRDQLNRWTAAMMTERPELVVPASDAMVGYLAGLIEYKRERPDDALLTALVQARVDGEHLTPEELVTTAILMVVAGHETTTGLIGNSITALLALPGAWEALTTPEAVGDAVEEAARWDPPVRVTPHYRVVVDIDLPDAVLPAGALVMVGLGTAGRDPVVHGPTASRFDPTRRPAGGNAALGHAAFGHGIHYCLGHHLARIEARAALTALRERFPDARLAGDPAEFPRDDKVVPNTFAAVPLLLER